MTSAAILVMATMAACFGQVVGRAIEEVGPTAGAVLGALVGFAAATIAAVRPPDPAGLSWRRIELFAFPTLGVVVLALTSGSIGVVPVLVALVIVAAIRTLIDSTVGDLRQTERMLDDRPTGAPPDRIRLRMLGVGLFLAIVSGYTVGVESGFTDLARPAAGGQLLAVLTWFVLGIISVGAVSRAARQRAWRVNHVDVADGVAERWTSGIAGLALVVVLVAVVTPIATSQLSALPAQAISGTDGLNNFVTRALELLSRDIGSERRDRDVGENDSLEAALESLEAQSGQRADWIGDVLLSAIIATVFVWAIRAGRNARFARGGRPTNTGGWERVKAVFVALVRELAALVRGIGRLFSRLRLRRRLDPASQSSVEFSDPEATISLWSPADAAEGRIARSFASVAALETPRRGETPTEVARAVGGRTDPGGAATVLGGYLRARYSAERMDDSVAGEVERAAEQVTGAALRQKADDAD